MTRLLEICEPAIERGERVHADLPIRNIHRVVGTITGGEITKKWGPNSLPEDTINLKFTGSAGLSFGAFVPKGMTLELEGDANDYVGKGLSGGKIIVYPPRGSTFVAAENIFRGIEISLWSLFPPFLLAPSQVILNKGRRSKASQRMEFQKGRNHFFISPPLA